MIVEGPTKEKLQSMKVAKLRKNFCQKIILNQQQKVHLSHELKSRRPYLISILRDRLLNPLEPNLLNVPPRGNQQIFFVLDSYVKNYILVSIFNIGGIYLVKE